jgi:hypothetical protein
MAKKDLTTGVFSASKSEWIVPAERIVAYSNVVTMRTTLWDMTMRFGAIIDGEKPKELKLKEVANISMSPGHFKEFVRIVSSQLKAYEERHGAIGPARDTNLDDESDTDQRRQ